VRIQPGSAAADRTQVCAASPGRHLFRRIRRAGRGRPAGRRRRARDGGRTRAHRRPGGESEKGEQAMNPLTELVVKVSLILSVALGLSIILGTKSAALRHWVLSVGIVCAATAPVLVSLAPAWHAPITLKPAAETRPRPIVRPARGELEATAIGVNTRTAAEAPRVRMTTLQVFVAIWIAGAVVGLATIIIGLGRLSWIRSRSRRLNGGM